MTGYQEIHRLMRLDFRKMGRGTKPINIKPVYQIMRCFHAFVFD